jgi:hypothetical protein
MAKEEVEECHSLLGCLCKWESSLFAGVVLFVIGLLAWATTARLINPDMLLPDALMVTGILFAMKGAFFSVFKK